MELNVENEKVIKECLICLDSIEEFLYFLPCWHHFHKGCIATWLKNSICCPTCKTPVFIDTPELMDIYLKFVETHLADENTRLNNLGTDSNSIAYHFMRTYDIPNMTGYNNDARLHNYYNYMIDISEEDSKEAFLEEVVVERIEDPNEVREIRSVTLAITYAGFFPESPEDILPIDLSEESNRAPENDENIDPYASDPYIHLFDDIV